MKTDLVRAEDFWPRLPSDDEFKGLYDEAVARGRQAAAESSVAIVGIARNAMPAMANTLGLLREVDDGFKSAVAFVYENDSTDDTRRQLLETARAWEGFETRFDALGGIDCRGEFEGPRTERLAKCRQTCLEWVRERAAATDYVICCDMDPARGFSVDGVFNSLAWMTQNATVGGMASYSLYRVSTGIAQYDSWAARANWWADRRHEIGFAWFSSFLPPVGSPPIKMNSAFGGLAVYRTQAYLAGGYSGEDCEHVPHHRRMADAGWSLYLNPGSRYIAVWED